ncbi:MAG: 4Fe-4S dicluster domain-containing protein [Oscillospiraceae bacterium]|jgi:2-oxoglutarate ferredoxin oxidoreductase subunit delta|nr:4Fe-4S dicluster domain-containing protein [Oscillospiraceae bacterium]
MAKFEVRVDGNVCKGCELCRIYCPKKILAMSTQINDRGYSPAEITRQEDCIGCKACAIMCPDGAISIYEEVAQ